MASCRPWKRDDALESATLVSVSPNEIAVGLNKLFRSIEDAWLNGRAGSFKP